MTRFALTATICAGDVSVAMVKCDACDDETIDDGTHTRCWLEAELMGEVRAIGDYFAVERHFCSPACAVLALVRET